MNWTYASLDDLIEDILDSMNDNPESECLEEAA